MRLLQRCSLTWHRVCSSPNAQSVEEITARGKALWSSIYTPHDVKLYNKLGGYHPDFIGASENHLPSVLLVSLYSLLMKGWPLPRCAN